MIPGLYEWGRGRTAWIAGMNGDTEKQCEIKTRIFKTKKAQQIITNFKKATKGTKKKHILTRTLSHFGLSSCSILVWLLSLQPPAQLVIKLSQMNESQEEGQFGEREVGGGGVNTDVQIKCEWFILPRLVAFSSRNFPMAKELHSFHFCPADCHQKLIFSQRPSKLHMNYNR